MHCPLPGQHISLEFKSSPQSARQGFQPYSTDEEAKLLSGKEGGDWVQLSPLLGSSMPTHQDFPPISDWLSTGRLTSLALKIPSFCSSRLQLSLEETTSAQWCPPWCTYHLGHPFSPLPPELFDAILAGLLGASCLWSLREPRLQLVSVPQHKDAPHR